MAIGVGAQIWQGGALLVSRQVITMVLSLGGMVALTRLIGPAAFGMYAGALGMVVGMQLVAQFGLKSYLVRQTELNEEAYHVAFTSLALSGLTGAALLVALSPTIATWIAQPAFGSVLGALALGLPVLLCTQVPMAKLERSLDFAGIAVAESIGVVTHYAVAVALAIAGLGAWAPVIGWWVHLVAIGVLALRRARHVPRLRWRSTERAAMWREGLSVSAASWLGQARHLAPTLIVGRFAGMEALGIVALAVRLVEAAGFFRPIAQRLSTAAFARLKDEPLTLRDACGRSMVLLSWTLGASLVALNLLAPWLLPGLFGAGWQPVVAVLPYLACSALALGLFTLATSALYALERFRPSALASGLHAVVLLGAGFLLVPAWGVVGYGLAELAACVAYGLAFAALSRRLGPIPPAHAWVWAGTMGAAMFFWSRGPWALVPLAVAVTWPGNVKALAQVLQPGLHAMKARLAKSLSRS